MTGAFRIRAIRLLCSDPERTACFFQDAFDAQRETNGTSALSIGAQTVEFAQATKKSHKSVPLNATGFQHFAIMVSSMEAAMAQLNAVSGWTAISCAGPAKLPDASGAVDAFKFRDCDGHPLELLAFKPDRTPPVWRARTGLFLGIDHTAITVAETNRSVAFYEKLGFEVTSRNVNTGEEQARLDGMDGPVVEVTSLAPPSRMPPHLELLCYRVPSGLDMPAADGDALATEIKLAGWPAGLPSRDPDGHRLVCESKWS